MSVPHPAPELAEAMAEPAKLRALLARVLAEFKPTGFGDCTARVGQAELIRLRKDAGLNGYEPAAPDGHAPDNASVPADELIAFGAAMDEAQKALAALAGENEHLKTALDQEVAQAVAGERERIKGLFDRWITIIMSEPNSHPPEAWKIAFADLVSDEPQFPIAGAAPDGSLS